MKAKVIIELNIPKSFNPNGPWSREQCLEDYIQHWLEQGYFINDYTVEFPGGIDYQGYKIKFPKEWRTVK